MSVNKKSMAFPQINIKSTNYELTEHIKNHLEKKCALLEKVIPADASVTCEAELEKRKEHQSGQVYRAEINVLVDGKLYRAESTEMNMEDAIDVAKDELKREIRRAVNKRQSLMRRGGKKIKDMLRFGE